MKERKWTLLFLIFLLVLSVSEGNVNVIGWDNTLILCSLRLAWLSHLLQATFCVKCIFSFILNDLAPEALQILERLFFKG